MGGSANVELVPRKCAANSVIGELAEGTEMTAKTAGKKNARLVERKIVVHSIMGSGGRWLVFLGMQKGSDDHAGQRQRETVARAQRVTAELEQAAIRRELRPEPAHVTCAATPSGLFCKTGNRVGVRSE